MSAFSKFMKLLSLAGGVRATNNPLTGRIRKSTAGSRDMLGDLGQCRTRRLSKNLIGRLKTYTPGADYTCSFAVELETDAISMRIGIPNVHTSAVTGVKASIAVSNSVMPGMPSRWTPSTGTWVNATFSGAGSVTLPAQLAAERQSFTFSDEINLQTIPRLDGTGRRWVIVKLEYPNGSVLSIPYSGFYYWHTTGASGRFAYSCALSGVLGVTTPAAYTPAGGIYDNVVIPAISYTSIVQGKQVLPVGDSTVEGTGGSPTNFSATLLAALTNSTPSDPVEVFNGAIHGQVPITYVEKFADLLSIVNPTHVVYSPYSVNDVSVGGMTVGQRANYYQALNRALALLDPRQLKIMLLEGLPVNYAGKAVGANDSIRIALNTALSAFESGNITVATGYANLLSGPVDGNGQTTISAGSTTDNIHPNATGVPLIAPPITAWLS